jgi:hypothetical protein
MGKLRTGKSAFLFFSFLLFFNTCSWGLQVCIAVKRVYVHADIYAKFMEIFVKVTKSLVIGDGFTNANLGPLQNEMQFNRIQSFLADIERNKYQIAAGGGSNAAKPGAGYFVTPTVVDNPPDNSMIVTDEPFGTCNPLFLCLPSGLIFSFLPLPRSYYSHTEVGI